MARNGSHRGCRGVLILCDSFPPYDSPKPIHNRDVFQFLDVPTKISSQLVRIEVFIMFPFVYL